MAILSFLDPAAGGRRPVRPERSSAGPYRRVALALAAVSLLVWGCDRGQGPQADDAGSVPPSGRLDCAPSFDHGIRWYWTTNAPVLVEDKGDDEDLLQVNVGCEDMNFGYSCSERTVDGRQVMGVETPDGYFLKANSWVDPRTGDHCVEEGALLEFPDGTLVVGPATTR